MQGPTNRKPSQVMNATAAAAAATGSARDGTFRNLLYR